MIDALNEKGVRTKALVRRDEFVAPPLFYEAVVTGRVKHQHLELLDYQMARLARKEVGDEFKLVRPSAAVEIDAAMSALFSQLTCVSQNNKFPTKSFREHSTKVWENGSWS